MHARTRYLINSGYDRGEIPDSPIGLMAINARYYTTGIGVSVATFFVLPPLSALSR